MKIDLCHMGFITLLFVGLLSMTSCEKEIEIPAYEIVNNALQGTWELQSVAFNGEIDAVDSGAGLITFTASETDKRNGSVLYEEVDFPDDIDTYTLSEDGKTADLWDEIAEISVNSTDLKITNREMEEGITNIFESNWKKK